MIGCHHNCHQQGNSGPGWFVAAGGSKKDGHFALWRLFGHCLRTTTIYYIGLQYTKIVNEYSMNSQFITNITLIDLRTRLWDGFRTNIMSYCESQMGNLSILNKYKWGEVFQNSSWYHLACVALEHWTSAEPGGWRLFIIWDLLPGWLANSAVVKISILVRSWELHYIPGTPLINVNASQWLM